MQLFCLLVPNTYSIAHTYLHVLFFIQSFPHFVSIEVVIFFIQAYLMVFVSGTRLCARIFSQVFLWKIFFGFFNFFFFWDYRIFPTEYTLSSKTLSIYLRLFQWWGIRLIKLIFFSFCGFPSCFWEVIYRKNNCNLRVEIYIAHGGVYIYNNNDNNIINDRFSQPLIFQRSTLFSLQTT